MSEISIVLLKWFIVMNIVMEMLRDKGANDFLRCFCCVFCQHPPHLFCNQLHCKYMYSFLYHIWYCKHCFVYLVNRELFN